MTGWFIDIIATLVGLLAAPFVIRGIYEPNTRGGRIVSILGGIALVAGFVWVWGQTGRDPLQQGYCFVRPLAPACANTGNGAAPLSIGDVGAKIKNWKIDSDGFGPIQIGMSVSDAYALLGLAPRLAFSGGEPTNSLSSCFYAEPFDGKLGFHLMVSRGKIVRIDVTSDTIRTLEGTGVGTSDQELRSHYAENLNVTPNRYTDGAEEFTVKRGNSENEIIFEVVAGKVKAYRIGTLEAAQLMEGCE
ncbi:MAG TPA: hypothetical protein VHC42_05745 [Rhizomicrobium sp.]|nr:hypothetical protein [Rhizomicrobium sp.]